MLVRGDRWYRKEDANIDHALNTDNDQGYVKRVETRTMTIFTEAKIKHKMARNGFRMHLPTTNNT